MKETDLYKTLSNLMFSKKAELVFYVLLSIMGTGFAVIVFFWIIHQINCF